MTCRRLLRLWCVMGQYTSFIVRIWSDDQGSLSGNIEEVASRESQTFRDLQVIVAFIASRLVITESREPRTGNDSGLTTGGAGSKDRK